MNQTRPLSGINNKTKLGDTGGGRNPRRKFNIKNRKKYEQIYLIRSIRRGKGTENAIK